MHEMKETGQDKTMKGRVVSALSAAAGAFRFLTILPVGRGGANAGTAGIIRAFPVVGVAQGLLLVAVAWAGGGVFPPGLTAALVLAALTVSGGGFHLDGLSDTFDGLAKRGDAGEKLAAMKDGRTGAIGAAAMVFSVLVKYTALEALSAADFYLPALFVLPVFSKWAMAATMYSGKSARPDGLGREFTGATGFVEISAVFLATLAVSLLSAVLAGLPAVLSLSALAGLFAAGVLMADFFRRRFGGLTGDTVGAASEAGEIIFLLMATAWQRPFIS